MLSNIISSKLIYPCNKGVVDMVIIQITELYKYMYLNEKQVTPYMIPSVGQIYIVHAFQIVSMLFSVGSNHSAFIIQI